MNIVVADISPKFGMMLSRSWEKRVGGTLQIDLSYATILVFGGEYRRLYREVQLEYLVSDSKHPNNHPIYSIEENFGSCMLQLSDDFEGVLQVHKDIPVQKNDRKTRRFMENVF